jgi:hypothetical protein
MLIIITLNAEGRYAVCRYAECHLYAFYVERCAECRYAECRGAQWIRFP